MPSHLLHGADLQKPDIDYSRASPAPSPPLITDPLVTPIRRTILFSQAFDPSHGRHGRAPRHSGASITVVLFLFSLPTMIVVVAPALIDAMCCFLLIVLVLLAPQPSDACLVSYPRHRKAGTSASRRHASGTHSTTNLSHRVCSSGCTYCRRGFAAMWGHSSSHRRPR